jgi:signal transduction histidine kinase/CheY-like chemotaxis protein
MLAKRRKRPIMSAPTPASTAPQSHPPLHLAVFVVGSIAIVLGLLVLLGWYTHSTMLMHVIPTAVPMPPSSALSFLLCGGGLIAISLGWLRLGVVCAASIAALSLLTLAAYVFGANRGVDMLLLPLLPTATLQPSARIAPNAAVVFLLASAALLVMTYSRQSRHRPLVAKLLGVVVLVLGGVAGLGYLVDLPMERKGTLAKAEMMGKIAQEINASRQPRFAITVFASNDDMYSHYQGRRQLDRAREQGSWLTLPGVLWRMRLWPTPELLTQKSSTVSGGVILAGLLIVMLLTALVHFVRTTRRHTAQVTTINQALQYEIAERKRAEGALRMSYQFLQSTLDALPAHIAILDASGTIVAVNMAWRHFADDNGFERPAYGAGMNYLAVCDNVSNDAMGEARTAARGIREVMGQQRSTFACEYACPSPSEQRWFLMRVVRFDSTEGVRVVVVHENITALKQAEVQVQRQQEALYQQEKLAAMGFLLASVSHELNNPLSIVMMQADLLREELAQTPAAERITELSQSAERCVRIVRNFLTLARQNPPQRTAVQLNAVVEEVMILLAYALRVDNIDVHQHLAADLPTLWADPHQLHQVVVNLVTNAQQALREAGGLRQLTITTRAAATRTAVALEVADTGRGIPPELQGRIFEPFFTTKPPGIGTGLGLPLCQGIIESHAGTITVQSQPGRGTVFCIELPVTVMPMTRSSASGIEPPAAMAMQQMDILVVDDEAGISKALAYLLRRDGHQVDTAANGHLALARLQERSYDLILCDLRMPELDGPGLYRALEFHAPHLLQRFIFLTGDTLNPEAQAFFKQTSAVRLNKPFRAAEVRRVVQRTLQSLNRDADTLPECSVDP